MFCSSLALLGLTITVGALIARRARRRLPSSSETYQRQGSSESSSEEEEEDEEEVRELRNVLFFVSLEDAVKLSDGSEEEEEECHEILFEKKVEDEDGNRAGNDQEVQEGSSPSLTYFSQESEECTLTDDGENRDGNGQEVRDASLTHYSQDSEQRMPSDIFEYKDGQAKRHDDFSFVWVPADLGNPADRKAARKAAKKEVRRKANAMGKHTRPSVIAILQDSQGNAFGRLSIKGKGRTSKFNDKQGSHQRKTLDKIPEDHRGCGHGHCAEQPIAHEVLFIRQHQERHSVEEQHKMFVKECKIIAYRRGDGRYKSPKHACSTCEVTNEVYGFEDKAGEASQSTASESGSQGANWSPWHWLSKIKLPFFNGH